MATSHRDPEPTIKALTGQGILNRHLQAMLRIERLSTNGLKAEMQIRVINREYYHRFNSSQ